MGFGRARTFTDTSKWSVVHSGKETILCHLEQEVLSGFHESASPKERADFSSYTYLEDRVLVRCLFTVYPFLEACSNSDLAGEAGGPDPRPLAHFWPPSTIWEPGPKVGSMWG